MLKLMICILEHNILPDDTLQKSFERFKEMVD